MKHAGIWISCLAIAGLAGWSTAGDVTPAAEKTAEKATNTMIIIKTGMGDIKAELFDQKAPETVKNFLLYVDDKMYDGTIFHRVIPSFMIQGGGFTTNFVQKPTRPPVKNEAGNGEKNVRGTLAMARTPAVDSATCQFFINVADNASLDHRDNTPQGYGYCVFGRVVEGMDIVEKIKGVQTGERGPHRDVPIENVVIQEIRRCQ